MKRITQFLVLMFSIFLWYGARAQVATYSFSHQIGTFTPNSANATNVPAVEADSGISAALPIGFNFVYGTATYTDFFMSSNGVITLGSIPNTLTTNNLSTANSDQRPIIAPLWDDLDGSATGGSYASYEVTGVAPNRVLTVEWLNWEWNWNSSDPVISFQVKLYETTNVIEFIYRNELAPINGTGSASIGINDATGSGNGTFLNLDADLTIPSVTSTSSVTSISTKPANNQVFRFTPPACLYLGTISVVNINVPNATLSLSLPASTGMDFYISDGAAPTSISTPTGTIAQGGSSLLLTNLLPGVNYTVYVKYACASLNTTWSRVLNFQTPCGVVDNFFENFDTTPVGSSSNQTFPYCWSLVNEMGTSGYGYVNTINVSAPRGYYMYRPNAADNKDKNLILISPETNNLGNGTKQLRFSVRGSTTSSPVILEIVRANGTTNTANFAVVATMNVNFTTFKEFKVPLAATTDDYFGFRLQHNGTRTSVGLYLDNIYYEDVSSCIFPINIKATNITSTNATISWNPSIANGVTGYEYEVRTSGAAGSGATGLEKSGTTTGATTVNITGLTVNTKYFIYVRSVCGSSKGEWIPYPTEFMTLCPVYTANFSEDFETTPIGSSTNPSPPACWTYIYTGTSTSVYGYTATAASQAGTGKNGFYVYRPTGTANTGDMYLISPETVVLGNGTKQLRFSAKKSNSSYDGKILIYSMDGNTANANKTLIATITTDPSTSWKEFIVPLPVTTHNYFAFSFEQKPNLTKYIYLDNIFYEDLGDCMYPGNGKVINITSNSATLSWDPSMKSGVTGYEYEVRTSGNPGSGTNGLVKTGITTATSENINGLTPGTKYTVYIRSICGNRNGDWTTYTIEFTTLCGVVGNFYEGFDTTEIGSSTNNNAPICWTNLDNITTNGYGYVSTSSPQSIPNSFYMYRTNSVANANEVLMLVSPETNNLGNGYGVKQVRFSLRSGGTSYNNVLELVRLNGNSMWSTATVIQTFKPTTTNYQEYTVILPQTTDDYFGFRLAYNGTTSTSLVYIDDVYYEDTPTCKPMYAKNIKVSNVTKKSFSVNWTDSYNVNVPYEIEVRTSGVPGTPGPVYITTTAAGVTNVNVLGLNPNTKYYVYVRALCSPTDKGGWSERVSVQTICDYSDFTSYIPALTICGPQKVKLSALPDNVDAISWWYDKVDDENPVFEGNNFLSDNIVDKDRSFWLRSAIVGDNNPAKVGDGELTDDFSGVFLGTNWGGYKHQYIYTVDELKEAGLVAGDITALKFEIVETGKDRSNFSVALSMTDQDFYDDANTHIDNSNFTRVYFNALEPFAVGEKTFTFTTPFTWDGKSNIVVQTNWSNEDTGSTPYGKLKYHAVVDNTGTAIWRNIYTYADNKTADQFLSTNTGSVAGSGNTSRTNARPNTVFIGRAGCISPAIEIPITVAPMPALELSSYMVTSCEGGAASDLVTITTNLGNYDTFTWTPSIGVTGDHVNGWTFSTAKEQDYVLSAKQSNGICENIKIVKVFSGKKPIANPSISPIQDVCKDVITKLNVLENLPTDKTIGDGLTTTSATSGISAFVQSAEFSKQQYIYKASELILQGVNGAGFITELAFETINSGASMSNSNYEIKMMLIQNTSFANDDFYIGDFSTVYSKAIHTHTFQGIQNIVLDNPFYWDGKSNVIIQITQEGMGVGNNNAQTYYSVVAGSNVGLYATSSTEVDPLSGTRTVNRLNARFSFKQAKVTWSPTNNLFIDALATIPYTLGSDATTVYTTSSLGGTQVYNAIITAPNGCSTTQSYTINTINVGTPVVHDQTFCKITNVNEVVVTGVNQGDNLSFYDSFASTTPITTIANNGVYYVESISGSCKSTRVPFNVTIVNLTLPTAQFTQTMCGGGKVSDLIASGTNGAKITWYSSLSSSLPLAANYALTNNTVYYASQVLNDCESDRVAVLVIINPLPPALSPQSISVCGGLDYGSVNLNQVMGSELVWYQSAVSQNPISNSIQITSGTYYVSQKINGCESPRVQIIVSAQSTTAPTPTANTQNICGGGTVSQLIAQTIPGGIALWYNSLTSTTPLKPTDVLSNGTYYVAQRIGNCLSSKVAVAVRITSTAAPTLPDFNLCEGATVADLFIAPTTGTSYKWYLNSNSATELNSTDILKSGFYFVVRVQNGCESPRAQVKVTINSRPVSPTGISPQKFDNYAEINNIVMGQANIIWYLTYEDAVNGKNPLPSNMPLVDKSTYFAVIMGNNGCPSFPTAIEVNITLGVNNFDLTKLKYWPNPVDDILTVSYVEIITKIEIFDLNGRLVASHKNDKEVIQLNLNILSSGTYMLKVETKENSQFVKIVKN